MNDPDLCARRAQLCDAMGLDPLLVAEAAVTGYPTIYESVPVLDAEGRGDTVISFDGSGGFLLEGISTRTRSYTFGSPIVPQFQIIDASRDRPLFSDLSHNQLFYTRSQYGVLLDINEPGAAGYCAGRLPKPYYFRPNSSLQIRHLNNPGEALHDVYLHGFRFRGCGGPPLPDPRFEPYAIRVRPTYDAVANTATASILVDQGQRFHLNQVCAIDAEQTAFALTQRVQITDQRIKQTLFEQSLPLSMLASPVGPYWKMQNPYVFEPMATITVDLDDIDLEASANGLYLVGWREWLR